MEDKLREQKQEQKRKSEEPEERRDESLNAPQAAERLNVHRSTVLRFERDGRLPAKDRVGKQPIFSGRTVDELAEKLRQERDAVESGDQPRRRGWMPGERRKAA